MVRTPQFILLWLMFLFGTFAGLLILGQLSTIGQEQAGLTPARATLLVMAYAVFNWLGRILTGLISDAIGRRATLLSIFMVQAISFIFFPR
jgi:nitrate/nitrite transporter NarK